MEDEAVSLSSEIHDLAQAGEHAAAAERLVSVHPADGADILLELEQDSRRGVIGAVPRENLARIIEYLPDERRREVIEEIPSADLAPLLDEVDDDIAADILSELPDDRRDEMLRRMRRAGDVEPLLEQEAQTAGAHMTGAFVPLSRNWTADQAIQFLRRSRPEADSAYYLYVLDPQKRLEGIVSLRDLIIAPPHAMIWEIMSRDVVKARDDMDQEEMARLVQRYDLIALPVVDAQDRVVGVVTVDDVLDVVEEEATEDILKLAGVGVKERALSPIMESARRRLPWLTVNMGIALVSAFIISRFEHTISEVAAVAAIMPIIAGQGGNAGIQTSTIVVRGLALDEIDVSDVLAVLSKEIGLGMLKGVFFGTALAMITLVWQGNSTLAVVAGAAMFLNMIVASVAGVSIPMTLRYGLKLDPATAAGVFDTMLTDIMGFFIFLGLATIFLSRLT
jgi:magnesium transporter